MRKKWDREKQKGRGKLYKGDGEGEEMEQVVQGYFNWKAKKKTCKTGGRLLKKKEDKAGPTKRMTQTRRRGK